MGGWSLFLFISTHITLLGLLPCFTLMGPVQPGAMQVDQGAFDPSKMYVWVKGLEGKINSLVREVDLVKNDLIRKNSSLGKEVKALNDEVLELKRQQNQFAQKMDLIIKELKQTAGNEEVQVIKKYVELWNPLSFVTQRDLERTVDARVVVCADTIKKNALFSPGVGSGGVVSQSNGGGSSAK